MSSTKLKKADKGGRRQYLVTYSKADLDKIPTRQSFAEAVRNEFDYGRSVVKVEHWACCLEKHQDGISWHYHCCVKLNGVKRWMEVKERLNQRYGIVVNFQAHDFYLSAYRYVTKEDQEVLHSPGHPNLKEATSPQTKKSIARNRLNATKRSSMSSSQTQSASTPTPAKKKKLNVCELAKFCIEHKIREYHDLLLTAKERRDAGQDDLADFVFSHTEKSIRENLLKAWDLEDSVIHKHNKDLTRMDSGFAHGCHRTFMRVRRKVAGNGNRSLTS